MILLLWFLSGMIAVIIVGWGILHKQQEITYSETGGLILLFASGFLGLVMIIIISVDTFFDQHGNKPVYKIKPKPEPVTKQVELNGMYNVPVDSKGEPVCIKIEKCEHEQPCYRPECNRSAK